MKVIIWFILLGLVLGNLCGCFDSRKLGKEKSNGEIVLDGDEILRDVKFANGLSVSALSPEIVQQGGGFEATNTDTVYFEAKGVKPIWQMAQWASKYDLAGTQPVCSKDRSVTYANKGKKITRFEDGTLLLDITTSTEYDAPRTSGEPWPHLLIQQDFIDPPNIGKIKQLNFSMDLRILHCENKMAGQEFNTDLHTAQSPFYFYMRNTNEQSPDYGLSLWVGVPSFDYRYPVLTSDEVIQWDIGTATYIYGIPPTDIWGSVSFHDFEWHSARLDLLPLIKRGVASMKSKGQFMNTELTDLVLTGMNFGWEIPGTFDTGLMLKSLSVKVVKDYTDVFVDQPTETKLEAMGAELDPHFFSQNLTRNDGSKESDWQYVVNRVKAMELKKFRVMALPQWYEPVNDNNDPQNTNLSKFTFDSPEMQSLYQVLDLAQEQDMDVCIVVWGCPVWVSLLNPKYSHVKTCFMADPTKKDVWITCPVNYDEWAENFSTLIKYLIEDRNYTCVKEITPMNEPDGGPLLTSPEYIKMAKVLDARFKKDGIREKVRFNLSDNTDTRTFYQIDCAENLSDVADIFNSHTYIFGYDTPNDTIYKWEKNNVNIAARAGKKHLVGEFGSNQCVGATRQKDIDLYARGVLMTRLMLNFLNAGAAGVSYWSLIDQYYGKDADYQQMQQLGLWKYIKEAYKTDSTYSKIKKDYEVRPQYYSYSLLTRFLKSGAEIYPLDMNDQFAIGSAFKDTDEKWTYVFANATGTSKFLAVNNSSAEGGFDIYRYEKDSLPIDDHMITSSENIQVKTGKLYVEVRPNSVVLCRQQ